jgi:hypothetical protein
LSDKHAIALTRQALSLAAAGASRRAIAAGLGLSHRRVQTILTGAAFASNGVQRTFIPRERDADWPSVAAALEAGSTLKAEHLKYATSAPAPFSLTNFWRRLEAWQACRLPTPGTKSPGAAVSLSNGVVERRSNEHAAILQRATVRKPLDFGDAYTAPDSGRALEGGLLFIGESGVALQVRTGALAVRYQDGSERIFPRGRHRVRSIILAGAGASVTIEAMRFAIDEGITILVMHRSGEALALLTDAPSVDASAGALELRRAQFAATPRQRLDIARAILTMKIEASALTPHETDVVLRDIAMARSHDDLLMVEARGAMLYWRKYIGFRPRLTDRCPVAWRVFRGRLERHKSQAIPRWARNPTNAALNYAYAVAVSNCTRALVGLGLDPCFGIPSLWRRARPIELVL